MVVSSRVRTGQLEGQVGAKCHTNRHTHRQRDQGSRCDSSSSPWEGLSVKWQYSLGGSREKQNGLALISGWTRRQCVLPIQLKRESMLWRDKHRGWEGKWLARRDCSREMKWRRQTLRLLYCCCNREDTKSEAGSWMLYWAPSNRGSCVSTDQRWKEHKLDQTGQVPEWGTMLSTSFGC